MSSSMSAIQPPNQNYICHEICVMPKPVLSIRTMLEEATHARMVHACMFDIPNLYFKGPSQQFTEAQ